MFLDIDLSLPVVGKSKLLGEWRMSGSASGSSEFKGLCHKLNYMNGTTGPWCWECSFCVHEGTCGMKPYSPMKTRP